VTGRPGWHTECVVMSLDLLGEGFDLHCGGQDLRFPHHENERAQAVALGKTFANHWMHNGFVVDAEGEKMSKSLGNVSNLLDLLDIYDPRAYRMVLLQSHYRSPGVKITQDNIDARSRALAGLDVRRPCCGGGDARARPGCSTSSAPRWTTTSTRRATALLFDTVRRANAALDAGEARRCDGDRDDRPIRSGSTTERRVPPARRAGARPLADAGRSTPMGYQPSLDGLRALSVGVVLLYHAGFSWMHGGFFGVEVFFVVSGFLITSLLLDETERGPRVVPPVLAPARPPALPRALRGAPRRCGVGGTCRDGRTAVTAPSRHPVVGLLRQQLGADPRQRAVLRRRTAAAAPPVEPGRRGAVVSGLAARVRRPAARPSASPGGRRSGARRCVRGVRVHVLDACAHADVTLGGPPAACSTASTGPTICTCRRSPGRGGLLLGAGTAFVWRPWRWAHAPDAPAGRSSTRSVPAVVAALGCAASVAVLTEGYVYQWLLPLVSILSLVAVMVAVHPAALGFRRIMSWTPLVEMGKRSYGLYLWSWPIFVIVGATTGLGVKFLWAMLLTVVVAEASYRYLETPVRQGAIGRWWGNRATITYWPVAGGAALVGVLLLFYANVEQFNRFEGGDDAVFDLDAGAVNDGRDATDGSTVGPRSVPAGSTAPTTPIVPATSARLAIVGDSQANALAINLPEGIEGACSPKVVNGSVDGCSVYDSGSVRSAVNFGNNFSICQGWQQDWADAAAGNDVALVVVGAWDVFDIDDAGTVYGFATRRRRRALRAQPPLGDRRHARRGRQRRTARGGVHAAPGRRGCRCPSAPRTRRRCACRPRQRTAAPDRGVVRLAAGGVRRGSRRMVRRRGRSPPTSATGGTASTSTNRARQLIYETIALRLLELAG
jgi:hypothetical protein